MCKETVHFSCNGTPDKVKLLNLQLKRLLGTTFPFYLPQRYKIEFVSSILSPSDKPIGI